MAKLVNKKVEAVEKVEAVDAVETATEVAPEVEKLHTTVLDDGTVAVKAKATQKLLEPKPWQRIEEVDGKQKLVSQIVFMGEEVDYRGDYIAEYRWGNLNPSDGLKRLVTARFPKQENPDVVEEINYMGFNIKIEKYGNSAVCEMSDAEGTILKYVSLATVIDVLQDLINDGDTCEVGWGTIDQSIKLKRGLKSRIKNLNENDLPAGRQKKAKTEIDESAETSESVERTVN